MMSYCDDKLLSYRDETGYKQFEIDTDTMLQMVEDGWQIAL